MSTVVEAIAAPAKIRPNLFTRAVRIFTLAMAFFAGASILGMMVITCAEVLLRSTVNRPITGARDLVSIAALLALAGAMPYTTAAKGHVTVEYFFGKLPAGPRAIISAVVNVLAIILFAVLTWQSVLYGLLKLECGEVALTLRVPVFWMPWVLALSWVGMVLVLLHQLLYPSREILKP